MTEPGPRDLRRDDFDELSPVTTRWSDNDMFGHLNNAVYLELFDTVLNAWMMRETGVDETVSDVIGVVAESSCRYYAEVSFPGSVDVGVRVARIGRTSTVLELGLFVAGMVEIAAHGEWVQVYIDRVSRRPVPIPDVVRAHLERSLARREPRAGRGDGAGPA